MVHTFPPRMLHELPTKTPFTHCARTGNGERGLPGRLVPKIGIGMRQSRPGGTQHSRLETRSTRRNPDLSQDRVAPQD